MNETNAMTIEKAAPWKGASDTEYLFEVFDVDVEVPHRLGIYIYAKRNAEGAWVPLYIGAGDLATRSGDPMLREAIDAKAPTHVHLRLMKRDEDRADEVRDLLAHYKNVFPPDGCQPEVDRPADAPPTASAPS